jgi:ASC-1-like (ASCH) protein
MNPRRVKTLWIKPQYLALILQGEKRVEMRVGYDNIRRLQPGDQLQLNAEHPFTIVRVGRYASFEEMLAHEDARLIAPGASESEILARSREKYPRSREIYPPDKEALGVVTLEIRPVGAKE